MLSRSSKQLAETYHLTEKAKLIVTDGHNIAYLPVISEITEPEDIKIIRRLIEKARAQHKGGDRS